MTESEADFFFGRGRETVEAIEALAAASESLPILIGNSGVGKSSVAQAGVLAALMRQDWPETAEAVRPWPQSLIDTRHWCFLKLKPGTEPVRSLVEPFLRIWQFDVIDPRREARLNEWTQSLIDGRSTLRDLLDATEHRLEEQARAKPPVFLIYVDQGEELFVLAQKRQRLRFSEILASSLSDGRLRVMMSMRADFFGELQKDESLYAVHRLINVLPLREAQLREVICRPAELLGAHFESDGLADDIAKSVTEESTKDAGALPLLSYLLDDMWRQMIQRDDGVLRLSAQAIDLGSVLVQRADAFLAQHPTSENQLRRIFILKLATVREDEQPTRRRAFRSEFSDEEWWLVTELADPPSRLLFTATPEEGETFTEVAHEALFRRWDKLREWIASEREFLIWKSGLEQARRAWQAAPESSRSEALLTGIALAIARSWLAKRTEDLPPADRLFIGQSLERERRARGWARARQAVVFGLLFMVITGLLGWINQSYLMEKWRYFVTVRPFILTQVRPHVLAAGAERALKPSDSFTECAENCPELVVIPPGKFLMGSVSGSADERPQHQVTIDRPFAASKFSVTFNDWDACVAYGDCAPRSDSGWGRGQQPVINVSWNDAQRYAAWLSRITGKAYRLLTEAEWEYIARAGTNTTYSFGNDEKILGEYAWYVANSENRANAVGQKRANAFGLYDMQGNVWEWVEDCYHESYAQAPTDGSAWTSGDCNRRVIRGGSWSDPARRLDSASRNWFSPYGSNNNLGFRIGRTLNR
jgi:formylglycine-generating enzyme required for sulfatase activity